MSEIAWLFVAFSAVWVALGIYLFSISARQKQLERRISQLDPHAGGASGDR